MIPKIDLSKIKITKKLLESEEISMQNARRQLLDALDSKLTFDVPKDLVQQELDILYENAIRAGKPFNEKREKKETYRRLKLGLILTEWGNENGITVENEEIENVLWQEVSRYANAQEVFELYRQNPSTTSMVALLIFEQKVLDAMLAQTNLKKKGGSKHLPPKTTNQITKI